MQVKMKRVFDILFSIVALVMLAAVMGIIALAIKLDSKGPVLFKQERLGKDGQVFKIFKFRTMIVDAEKKGRGIFQDADDNRITKVGKFLRETSLDELPQLFNIIKGDMSFVGPRPPLTYYPYPYEAYSAEQKTRFQFLPGITGYAQVMGRNSLSWEEKINYDNDYIENYSLRLDVKILILTLYKIVKKENVYHPDTESSITAVEEKASSR